MYLGLWVAELFLNAFLRGDNHSCLWHVLLFPSTILAQWYVFVYLRELRKMSLQWHLFSNAHCKCSQNSRITDLLTPKATQHTSLVRHTSLLVPSLTSVLRKYPTWSQLSNIRWMPNSVSKGFDTAMKTGSSRRFKWYPTTYMWVSSQLPFTMIRINQDKP